MADLIYITEADKELKLKLIFSFRDFEAKSYYYFAILIYVVTLVK